jgi:hypothetical protein
MAANQNVTQLTQQTGTAAPTSLFYAVTGGTTDTGLPLSVLVNSLGLTGIPTAPTATNGTNTTQIATTAYVVTYAAPLASPVFTGTPSLPTGTIAVTQTAGNNSTAVATTSFVATSFAPLASPTFTGIPVGPTAATGTSTTQLATTAFVANTFAAPPSLGATTPNAVHATTIGASGLITPTSTIGIVGTIAADNTQAGSIGEYITATSSAVSLTSGSTSNIVSISLTAGDWDVSGSFLYSAAAGTTTTFVSGGVSTTSVTFPSIPLYIYLDNTFPTAAFCGQTVPTQRINVSSTTTVYLVGSATFAVSTATMIGYIRARRTR